MSSYIFYINGDNIIYYKEVYKDAGPLSINDIRAAQYRIQYHIIMATNSTEVIYIKDNEVKFPNTRTARYISPEEIALLFLKGEYKGEII